jgi:hypothetical protein
MAEAGNKNLEPVNTIYLGEGKPDSAPKTIKQKADTEYNKRMQEVFDIVSKEALAEREDVQNTQTELALLTAETLMEKPNAWQRFKEHKNVSQFISELDTEWRGRELPRKLDRILVFSVLGGASMLMDYGADALTSKLLSDDNHELKLFNKQVISFTDANGNREALKAGLDFVSDDLIGAFANISVKEATNTKDAKFVSSLSKVAYKVGNLAATFLPADKSPLQQFVNSTINPGTIEAMFRISATMPVVGALVEKGYNAANKAMKNDEILPLGFDLGLTILAAKVNHTSKKS